MLFREILRIVPSLLAWDPVTEMKDFGGRISKSPRCVSQSAVLGSRCPGGRHRGRARPRGNLMLETARGAERERHPGPEPPPQRCPQPPRPASCGGAPRGPRSPLPHPPGPPSGPATWRGAPAGGQVVGWRRGRRHLARRLRGRGLGEEEPAGARAERGRAAEDGRHGPRRAR